MPRAAPLLCALLLALAEAKWINSYAGPFIATTGPRFYACQKGRSENLIQCNVKITQFKNHALESQKGLQRVSGNVTLDIPLDDTLWQKDNAFLMNFPGGACKATRDNFPDFFYKLYKDDPTAGKGPCYRPKGVYFLDDVPMNWTIPRFTVFPYGNYRVELGYNLGPVSSPRNIMCFHVDVLLQPVL